LQSGELWLHSPTEPRNSLVNRIAGLGRVRYLIAPNNMHYWWISDWKLRFPDAEIFAVPELCSRARRPSHPFSRCLLYLKDTGVAQWTKSPFRVIF
jgi:hypothetical protein